VQQPATETFQQFSPDPQLHLDKFNRAEAADGIGKSPTLADMPRSTVTEHPDPQWVICSSHDVLPACALQKPADYPCR